MIALYIILAVAGLALTLRWVIGEAVPSRFRRALLLLSFLIAHWVAAKFYYPLLVARTLQPLLWIDVIVFGGLEAGAWLGLVHGAISWVVFRWFGGKFAVILSGCLVGGLAVLAVGTTITAVYFSESPEPQWVLIAAWFATWFAFAVAGAVLGAKASGRQARAEPLYGLESQEGAPRNGTE